jgi:ketosteroid isomerase-like protein
MGDSDERERNKQVVLDFLDRAHAFDLDGMARYWAEDCTRYGPRPSSPLAAAISTRAALMAEIPKHLHLYTKGTLKTEVERLIAEGPFVAIQYILRAKTGAGEDYENYYHYMFEIRDGRIKNYWEYLDTRYAQAKLFKSGP